MQRFLFFYGRDKVLSYLELLSYFQRKGIAYQVVRKAEDYFILEGNLDPVSIIEELGGTVKIGLYLGDDIEKLVPELLHMMPGKVYYSLQDFDQQEIVDIFKEEFKKQRIKAQNISFKISPSEIIKKNLLQTGSDFIYAEGMLFRTVAVSNPFALEKRDIGRPVQDVTGAISLRLAKILINLSQISHGTLLDPFCGIGSIVQEASLMGLDCIGVDFSEEKINAARENFAWLEKHYAPQRKAQFLQGDARSLSQVVKRKVQSLVTEPYLGELIKSKLSSQEAEHRIQSLVPLYRDLFREAYQILEHKGFMVIILPYFFLKKNKIRIPVESIHGKFRLYNPEKLIPVEYGVGKNKIGREIYIFRKI